MTMSDALVIEEALAALLKAGEPVVALETAVLTHGFAPEVARVVYDEMLGAVREAGAVPAPVALLDGRLCVGLSAEQLDRLASGGAAKAGIADLAPLAARGADAGTTVAATLLACKLAGVAVFATGGIGGAHRGVETSFDVSGDLTALSRYGGCVVCSGAKSVCDLPKTLEILETLGVPVVGCGTDEFPAFTSAASGCRVRHRVDTPEEAARVIAARDALGLSQALLLVQPPPAQAALSPDAQGRAVEAALAAEGQRHGPEATPALLAALATATAGASVAANRALLIANASLAARVAVALSRRRSAQDA